MDGDDFLGLLERMSRTEILAVAAAVEQHADTVDGEVDWWRATVAVQVALRAGRRCREAGRVSREASRAVMRAAERAGLGEEHRPVTVRVARAAGDAARGLLSDAPPQSRAALLAPFGLTTSLR